MCRITQQSSPGIDEVIVRRREKALLQAGWLSLLGRIATIAIAAWLLLTFCFTFTRYSGQDMYPALKDGDLCVVYRNGLRTLLGERLVKGDIIVYTADGSLRISRVAAVAGDVVNLTESGSVTVNSVSQSGEILYPTYVRGDLSYPFTVPDGCVYVLGDYRTDTHDSRDFGPVPLSSVGGKVISILRRRGL